MYEGKIKDGHKEGFGEYILKNGGTYNGEWIMSEKHGHGVEIWPDGS